MTHPQWLLNGQHCRALIALGLASILCVALVMVRARFAGHTVFSAFVWNLILAWVPLLAALLIHTLRKAGARWRPFFVVSGVVWLLFFPNAPYILTDIVHLKPRAGVPYWYDQITILAFALTGLLAGYLSLFLMQEVVRERLGRAVGWWFALVSLALGAFGIYLGRFVRLNSWDVLLAPLTTLSNVAHSADPVRNPQALAFSVTFFGLSFVGYLMVYSFAFLRPAVSSAD